MENTRSVSASFFHFFCRCPPQEVRKANSKVPHILTCYTILHRHRTAARQEFYAKIVQSLHCLNSLSEKLCQVFQGLEWIPEEDGRGSINRKFSHFLAWADIGKNINRYLSKLYTAYTPLEQNPRMRLACLLLCHCYRSVTAFSLCQK